MKRLIFSILVAATLWFLMFSSLTAPLLNFWWAMAASAVVLTTLACQEGVLRRLHASLGRDGHIVRSVTREVLLGIAIAVVLWGVFWVGDKVASWLFPFARPQVDLIYGMKTGNQPWLIALLLLFIIGPAEELFWRGYVQHRLSERWSPTLGYVCATAIYTLVHLPSGNFMLIMAAMVCGVCWGGLYRLMPRHFLAILLSHALWDCAAFVWFPI
ncbi:MAG: CPBP family intramembrane metalloprotease [Bacteroidaceae bacterium]|nr:CPBP family intramembrane metalloprotease [Bacteroidaceae bacterium]